MKVIGVTGSIGMGKSTVARQLASLGGWVHDADLAVRHALETDARIIAAIGARFPEAVKHGKVDRKALGRVVFGDDAALAWLEGLLHPAVWRAEAVFRKRARRAGARFIVLDIPLLFETRGERRCDLTLAASAPAFLQRQRVMRRGVPEAQLTRILARQMPDAEKRRRANYVVRTGNGRRHSLATLTRLLKREGLA